MALISLWEIAQLVIVSGVLGYIFMQPNAARPKTVYDMMYPKKFNWDDFKFAVIVASPGVVLHELAHKFVAMGYGLSAEFHMWTFGLALGVILKLVSSPLLIIAPGFVTIPFFTNEVGYRLIAFAGPLVNLVLWIGSMIILRTAKNLTRKQTIGLGMLKYINMILFFFNMLPFGPLDGAKVLFGPSGL
tara:strand:+ start:4123 stop:4686 length:564 start_codon:yes stop_codon:yes gene_type:complete